MRGNSLQPKAASALKDRLAQVAGYRDHADAMRHMCPVHHLIHKDGRKCVPETS